MDKIIKKKIIKHMVIENICWGGLPFYSYDLQAYLKENLSLMNSGPAISHEITGNCRNLWKNLSPEVKLTFQAGLLIPAAILSFTSVMPLPDLDIKLLGIGWHRYFLFHSAMGLWIMKEFFDTYSEYAEGKGTEEKIFGSIGAGCAAAIGLHLLKDGAFGYFEGEKSVVFGFPGIFKRNTFIKGTYLDDNLWLLANSLWAFKVSKDIFVIAFGEEISVVKDFIYKNFRF